MTLEIDGLALHLPLGPGEVLTALDGVDLRVASGEAVALAGDSGAGKTLLLRVLKGEVAPTGGSIRLAGRPLPAPGPARDRLVQVVTQVPRAAFDPDRTLLDAVADARALVRPDAPRDELEAEARAWLARAGLPDPFADRLPHAMSNGQRQRACLARALAAEPLLLALDEPTSALDLPGRREAVALLAEARAERPEMSLLAISQDAALLRATCPRLAVMHLGRIVEDGPLATVAEAPRHPYSRALLAPAEADAGLAGDAPSALSAPEGCRFRDRCPNARPEDCSRRPAMTPLAPGHAVACHRPHPAAA